jgi:uncharacterized sporulation protein YeaH/YhbH (DUF444 family)
MKNDQRLGSTLVDLDEVSPYELLRVQRLARELRLTDQILSVDLDSVAVVNAGPAPAWTTLEGDKVAFAYNRMPNLDDRAAIAVWLGTNAHELGHVLFSPRRTSTLMYRVLESDRAYLKGIATMHNIVEDQRQERLILARFAPWTGYLTAALGHHLVADDESAWLLMAGRTWLPDSVRAVAKARMIATRGQHDTDEVTRIVGEYQRLTDPGDTECDIAWELLQELHRMFEDNPPPPSNGTCVVMDGGEPTTDDPTGTPYPTADEAESDDDDAHDDDDASDGDDADDDDDDGDGDGSGAGDTSATDKTPEGGDDADAGGAGAGDTPSEPLTRGTIRKALKDAARDIIRNDQSAADELDSITDAVEYGRPGDIAEGDDAKGRYDEPTDTARQLHREVSDALMDLKNDAEPGWNRRTDSGKLNVRRLLNPTTEPDAMFDRYEPGMMDAAELEVVLLLDVSGSMHQQCHALGEATYAIRHAIDDLEGTITVVTFDSGPHRLLAAPGDRPDGRMFVPSSQGGTQPKTAIHEAWRVLAGASAKNRLFIVLTDGDWYSTDNDATIVALAESGVTTMCVLLGTSATQDHGCQYVAHIEDPTDLARLFRQVAVDRISSWYR